MSEKNKEEKTEKKTIVGAFILEAKDGEALINALGELPYKFKPILDPVVTPLLQCIRGDITIDVPVTEKK